MITTHNGIKEKGIKPIDIKDYPAIKSHLDQYYSQLEKRTDKGDTPYNLRNCAYMDDFFRPKVMWKIIGSNINFCFDKNSHTCNNAVNIMIGKEVELINFIGLMNSKLYDWYLKLTTTAEVQGGGVQLYSTVLENIPVNLNLPNEIFELITLRMNDSSKDNLINEAFYIFFDLTIKEIELIEN